MKAILGSINIIQLRKERQVRSEAVAVEAVEVKI